MARCSNCSSSSTEKRIVCLSCGNKDELECDNCSDEATNHYCNDCNPPSMDDHECEIDCDNCSRTASSHYCDNHYPECEEPHENFECDNDYNSREISLCPKCLEELIQKRIRDALAEHGFTYTPETSAFGSKIVSAPEVKIEKNNVSVGDIQFKF